MKKLVIPAAICALLVMAGCGGCLFLLIQEKPLLEAELTLPLEVRVGETIEMVVKTSNPYKQPVILQNIDIDSEFFRGFQVVSVVPKATDVHQSLMFDHRSWSFEKSVPPAKELTVKFELKAIEPGRFAGNIYVCNPSQSWRMLYADVVVHQD